MATTTTSRPVPRPLRLTSGSISSLPSSPLSSTSATIPYVPSLSSPLHRELSFPEDISSPRTRHGPRRQSSISYNTSSSSLKSPGLQRSNSVGSKVVIDAVNTEVRSEDNPLKLSLLPAVREGEPITLAEKHADLLHFIAQKEAKCLELRTQLAQHESDLLQLKRKWERIVSKGVPQSARSDATTATEVFEGIRGGVQSGLEKVFAVLEPGAVTASSQPASTPFSTPVSIKSSPSSETPLSKSAKRISVSTTASASTHNRSSLSGSRSSAGSLFDEISSTGEHSLDSSVYDDDDTACLSSNTEKPSEWSSSELPSREGSAELSSSILRKSRPLSIGLSQFSTLTQPPSLSPLGKQVANWVPPSLNKKWEELKGNETISKQSKRASVLFNDMLSALASPQMPSVPQKSPVQSTGSLPTLKASNPPSSSAPVGITTNSTPITSWMSILDEDVISTSSTILQPEVLKPMGAMATKTDESQSQSSKKKVEEEDDEEEWNW